MKTLLPLLLLSLLSASLSAKRATAGQLLASVVIHRHGDRAPQNNAPAYAAGTRSGLVNALPFDDGKWPVDYGQLTGTGMAQAAAFGRWLRARYVDGNEADMLLSGNYDHKETHVRATDVDRTLATAMYVMAGLYPADSGPSDKPPNLTIANQVPIHTVAYNSDSLMDGSSSSHCPLFKDRSNEVLNSDYVLGDIAKRTDLLAALPELLGKNNSWMDAAGVKELVAAIATLRDMRTCQEAHNKTVPKSISRFDSDFEQITRRAVEAKWDLTGLGPNVGGRLLRAVATRFTTMVAFQHGEEWAQVKFTEECNAKGTDSDEDGGCPRRLAVYSGHDTTVFDTRAALGIPATTAGICRYLAHVVIELRRDNKDEFVVTVLAGDYATEAKEVAGKFCGGKATCPLDEFLTFVGESIPKNINEACGLPGDGGGGGSVVGSRDGGVSAWHPLFSFVSVVVAVVTGQFFFVALRGLLRRRSYSNISD